MSSSYSASDPESDRIFWLGVIGFFACGVLSPVAWWQGNQRKRRLAQLGQPLDSRAHTGRMLGIVGTMLPLTVLLAALAASVGMGALIVLGIAAQ